VLSRRKLPVPPGAAVPHHGRLALVGDSHGGQIHRGQAERVHGCLRDRARVFPDLDRVVLNPPGSGHDLLVLELVPAHLVAAVIEDHEAGAGGSLVDGTDEVSHSGPSR
jgi:hypothetical protein